jgi:hypothetical protein
MFKPTVHRCQISEGDESFEFFVREPSGREILQQAAKQRKDASAVDNAKELFARYVVHEDGSAISEQEVDALLDMRLSAMHKVSEAVQDKIGLRELTEKKL